MAERYRVDVLVQTFALTRYGKLLLCNALIAGPQSVHAVILLLDTGSNYTVVAVEPLEKIGCGLTASQDHVRIMTGNGPLIAPRVRTQAITVFQHQMAGVEVIAHDLPFSGPIDGLLGMDVLVALRARIDTGAATIEIE